MSMKDEREKGDMASVGRASSSPPKAIVWLVAECLDLLSVYDHPRRLFLTEGFAMESSRRARDAGPSLSSHQSWLLSCNTALAREQAGAADLPPVLRHAKSGPKKPSLSPWSTWEEEAMASLVFLLPFDGGPHKNEDDGAQLESRTPLFFTSASSWISFACRGDWCRHWCCTCPAPMLFSLVPESKK